VRPEGLGELKNSLTSSGLQPATFRLEAHRALTSALPRNNFKPKDRRMLKCMSLTDIGSGWNGGIQTGENF
jgi:hypothetical protein